MIRRNLTPITLVITLILVVSGVFIYRNYLGPILKNNSSQTVEIDLNQNSPLVLVKKQNQGNVYSLEIEIEGNSSEIINLELGESQQKIRYDARIKNGEIDFVYTTDWYSDTCFLNVQPSRKNNGKLSISYRFLALN